MQTFLPLADLRASAEVLDKKRAFKQVVECGQILKVLDGVTTAWRNHPAVKMWSGFSSGLKAYHDILYDVCESKHKIRFVKTRRFGILSHLLDFIAPGERYVVTNYSLPPWFGDERFHAAHRSNLLRKAPQYYSQFGWKEPADLPYYWPNP